MKNALATVFLSATLAVGCGSKAATQPVIYGDHAAFANVWTQRPVLLVGLGDSMTAGFGSSPGDSYFERLAQRAADDAPDTPTLRQVFPRLSLTNLAISGSTSADLENRQLARLPQVDRETVGWVVITTGGNDIIHAYGRMPPRECAMFGATTDQARPWIAQFEMRLQRIVTAINRRFPGGCQIFLADIYDPTDGRGDTENAPIPLPAWKDGTAVLAAYNQVIERVAHSSSNVHRVQIHERFLGHGIHHGSSPYWYFANLEDPNDAGYDVIRRAFLEEMTQNSRFR